MGGSTHSRGHLMHSRHVVGVARHERDLVGLWIFSRAVYRVGWKY